MGKVVDIDKVKQAKEDQDHKDSKDTRYLEDIQADAQDNISRIMQKCTVKCFPSKVYAQQYRMHLVEKAFRDLGFSPQDIITSCPDPQVAAEQIDAHMILRQIRFEDWAEHPDDMLKGAAIWKGDELVYFIALVRQSAGQFMVKSNVKFND
jgi:hypothetical protein